MFRRRGVALETGYHLSYPFLLEFEGELYMIPEQGASGRLRCYRCVEYPLGWRWHCTLFDEPLADATLFRHDGDWSMLPTRAPLRRAVWMNSICTTLPLHLAPG